MILSQIGKHAFTAFNTIVKHPSNPVPWTHHELFNERIWALVGFLPSFLICDCIRSELIYGRQILTCHLGILLFKKMCVVDNFVSLLALLVERFGVFHQLFVPANICKVYFLARGGILLFWLLSKIRFLTLNFIQKLLLSNYNLRQNFMYSHTAQTHCQDCVVKL